MTGVENIDYALSFTDKEIAYSQAVSLKRIADALEKLITIPTMQPLTEEQAKKFEHEWAVPGNIVIKE